MVFGIDDVLEGFAISDIIYFIGSAIFGEVAVSSSIEGTTLVIQDLLGETGLEAILDLAKNETTGLLANEVDVPLFEQVGVSLWDEEALTETGNLTKNGFIDRVKTIAQQLTNKGVNIASSDGKELLTTIVNKAIDIGKSGVKEAMKPKYIIPAVLGSGGVAGAAGIGGAIKLFKKKTKKVIKKILPSEDLIVGLP